MKDTKKEIWFPAKTYGWGWGFPSTWQGWTVFLIYFALLAFGIVGMYANALLVPFVIYFVVITVAFIFVCYLKGEKPGWRWGK